MQVIGKKCLSPGLVDVKSSMSVRIEPYLSIHDQSTLYTKSSAR